MPPSLEREGAEAANTPLATQAVLDRQMRRPRAGVTVATTGLVCHAQPK